MAAQEARARSPLRSVAVPSEHGGWGLTLEPVLLGLLVAPSVAGALLGVAAFLAFVVRTPLKLALVDLRRDRWLARTRLATTVAVVELTVIAVLAVFGTALAGPRWWTAVAIAAPFVAVELWFDIRSRGRRLVPELCGAIGVCAVVAAITLAAGEDAAMAAALWVLLAARGRGDPLRPHADRAPPRAADAAVDLHSADLAQVAAIVVGAFAVALVGRAISRVRRPRRHRGAAPRVASQAPGAGEGPRHATDGARPRARAGDRGGSRPRMKGRTVTMTIIDEHMTLGELVDAYPQFARELEQRGLDYCCRGGRPIAEACDAAGLDQHELVAELTALTRRPTAVQDWTTMTAAELVGHIVSTHHRYLWAELPRLTELVEKVVRVHGAPHPELHEVAARSTTCAPTSSRTC